MTIRPCTLKQANALVDTLHRHHKPVQGHRFSLSIYDGDQLAGVAICGRPVARMCDTYETLEITRCATNGATNAISQLYGAICRAAKAMGYHSVQTYTLPSEGGASLKASGFTLVGDAGGGDWNRASKPNRRTDQPMATKWKWSRTL